MLWLRLIHSIKHKEELTDDGRVSAKYDTDRIKNQRPGLLDRFLQTTSASKMLVSRGLCEQLGWFQREPLGSPQDFSGESF